MKKFTLCLLALSLAVFMAGSAFATDYVTSADVLSALKTAEVGKLVDNKSVLVKASGDYEYDDANVLYIKEASMKKGTLHNQDDAYHGLYMVELKLVQSPDVDISLASSDAKPYTYFSSNDVNVWEKHDNDANATFWINSRDYSVLTTVGSFSGDIASVDESTWVKASVKIVEELPSVVAEANVTNALEKSDGEVAFKGKAVKLTSADLKAYVESSELLQAHAKNSELELIVGAKMNKKSNDFTISPSGDKKVSSKTATEEIELTSFGFTLTVSEDKSVDVTLTKYITGISEDFNLIVSSDTAFTADDSITFKVAYPAECKLYMGSVANSVDVKGTYFNGEYTFYATLNNSNDNGVKFSDLATGADFIPVKTASAPGSSSSGCNAVGFVPAALLLVAPLFFLKK